jgi:thiamine biosynthesis protein ThiS
MEAGRIMGLEVNGQTRAMPAPATVGGLVADMGLDARGLAVERNRAIVPRSAWDDTTLQDGDKVEIVQFVGGG